MYSRCVGFDQPSRYADFRNLDPPAIFAARKQQHARLQRHEGDCDIGFEGGPENLPGAAVDAAGQVDGDNRHMRGIDPSDRVGEGLRHVTGKARTEHAVNHDIAAARHEGFKRPWGQPALTERTRRVLSPG